MQFNPHSLTRLASRNVNMNICSVKDFEQLLLPTTLKDTCRQYYVEDKLSNITNMSIYDSNNHPYDHTEPYIQLDLDEYVNFQRINEIPWFAYEKNHIQYEWYEVERNNERLCFHCAHVVAKLPTLKGRTIQKYKACEAAHGYCLIHALQDPAVWCSRCVTTTLFYISQYYFQPHNHYSAEYTKALLFEHTVE